MVYMSNNVSDVTTVGFKYLSYHGSNVMCGPVRVLTLLTQLEPLGLLKEQDGSPIDLVSTGLFPQLAVAWTVKVVRGGGGNFVCFF